LSNCKLDNDFELTIAEAALLCDMPPRLAVTSRQLAAEQGIPLGSVHRIVADLVRRGWPVTGTATQGYWLRFGPRDGEKKALLEQWGQYLYRGAPCPTSSTSEKATASC